MIFLVFALAVTVPAKTVILDTEKGKITLELDEKNAPKACALFLELAGKGAFNGSNLIHAEKLTAFFTEKKTADIFTLNDTKWQRGAVRMTAKGGLVAIGILTADDSEGEAKWRESLGASDPANPEPVIFARVSKGLELLDALPKDARIVLRKTTRK